MRQALERFCALPFTEGLSLVTIGVGLGLAGGLALTRTISSLLFGVTPSDPATFGCGLRMRTQKMIFITRTISLGSEVSSMDAAANLANLTLVTSLEARFPNQG